MDNYSDASACLYLYNLCFMKVFYLFTNAKNGGFGVLGKGIKKMFKESDYFELVGEGLKQVPKKEPDIVFTYGTPDLFREVFELRRDKHWNNFKHVHYFVWESSKIPADFIIEFHRADMLITSCEYMRKVASRQGLKKTLVWHHAVDDRFKYIPKDYSKGTFTFLHHNAYEYRKNTPAVLEAFTREFTLQEDVKLIIKARDRRSSTWLAPKIAPYTAKQLELKVHNIEKFKKKHLGIEHPQIEEIIGHISDAEMVRLNSEAHCFVFPALGEGWGLPPFEAMAMGIVPIIPVYSCFSEWFDQRCMLGIKEEGYINTEPRYTGYMFSPSMRQLRKQMRWAFEHRENLQDMGMFGSALIHSEYNWEKVHNELVSLVQNYKWPKKKRMKF